MAFGPAFDRADQSISIGNVERLGLPVESFDESLGAAILLPESLRT